MGGVYHVEDKKNIHCVRAALSGSSPVQFLISQNSGKDKPPSIDAINGPNEHGRARSAASVSHDMTQTQISIVR